MQRSELQNLRPRFILSRFCPGRDLRTYVFRHSRVLCRVAGRPENVVIPGVLETQYDINKLGAAIYLISLSICTFEACLPMIHKQIGFQLSTCILCIKRPSKCLCTFCVEFFGSQTGLQPFRPFRPEISTALLKCSASGLYWERWCSM